MKWYADDQNDRPRPARKDDAPNYITQTEDAAWVQIMHTASCRCASAGNRAANARTELRKLEEESLRSAERLSRIMDEMPRSARQFREKALEAHDLQAPGQRGEG